MDAFKRMDGVCVCGAPSEDTHIASCPASRPKMPIVPWVRKKRQGSRPGRALQYAAKAQNCEISLEQGDGSYDTARFGFPEIPDPNEAPRLDSRMLFGVKKSKKTRRLDSLGNPKARREISVSSSSHPYDPRPLKPQSQLSAEKPQSEATSVLLDAIEANTAVPAPVASALKHGFNRSMWHSIRSDKPKPNPPTAEEQKPKPKKLLPRWRPGYPVPNRTATTMTPRSAHSAIVELEMPISDTRFRQPLPMMHWIGLSKCVNQLGTAASAALIDADHSPNILKLTEAQENRLHNLSASSKITEASASNPLGETLTLDQLKIQEESRFGKKEEDERKEADLQEEVPVSNPTQMLVFKNLASDGEIHFDLLLPALRLLGFPQLRQEWVTEMAHKITPYVSMTFPMFENFCKLYELRQSDAFVLEFQRFDNDGSGSMDASELGELLRNIGAYPLPHVLHELIKEVDDNGTGQLEVEEFQRVLLLLQSREGFSKSEVEEFEKAFLKFDRDKSGNVSSEELVGILGWLGYPQRIDTMQKIMRQADSDGSGDLSWPEYLVCMRWYREHEVEFVQGLMAEYDSDGNGLVDKSELETLLKFLGYVHPRESVIFECMEEAGLSSDEPLDFPSLWLVLQVFRLRGGFLRSEEDNNAEAFTQYDRQGEGFITTFEVGKAMRMLGYLVPIELQHKYVKYVDVDGSGLLDLSEFRTLMRRHREVRLQELEEVFDYYATEAKGGTNGSRNATPTPKIEENMEVKAEENIKVKVKLLDVENCLRRAVRRVGLGNTADNREMIDLYCATHAGTSISFLAFADLVSEIREASRERMRQNAGFAAEEVAEYKAKFQVYDTDGTGDIAGLELRRLLDDIFPDAARSLDQRARIERILSEVDQDGSGSLDFADFLRLMRHYHDDCQMEELKFINESFSEEEAAQFREIFNAECKDRVLGQDLRITIGQIQIMITKICPLDTTEIEKLGKIVRECLDDPDARSIDYTEFLRIMRRIIDQNLGNIIGASSANRNGTLKEEPISERQSPSVAARKTLVQSKTAGV